MLADAKMRVPESYIEVVESSVVAYTLVSPFLQSVKIHSESRTDQMISLTYTLQILPR